MKITKTRKMSFKAFLLAMMIAAGATVAGPTITAYADTQVTADNANEGDDLFVDTTNDSKTEDIQHDDLVDNNTVVDETKKEEKKTEEKKTEEKKNNCVTPDNGYTEGEGQYWDPNIKTEEEKKGLTPDKPDIPVPKTGVDDLSFLETFALIGSMSGALYGTCSLISKLRKGKKANIKKR